MTNDDMDDIDSIIVTKSSKSAEVKKEINVEPDTWYEARLAKIMPYTKKNKNGFENKNLRWIFELVGEEFVTEYNGNPCQHAILTNTSTFMAPGTRLCEMYCNITGKSPEDIENSKVSIKALVGKPCYIMVEQTMNNDGGIWYGIKAVKSINSTVNTKKKSAKTNVKLNNPDLVTDPKDIKFELDNTESDTKSSDNNTFTPEEEELFKSINI